MLAPPRPSSSRLISMPPAPSTRMFSKTADLSTWKSLSSATYRNACVAASARSSSDGVLANALGSVRAFRSSPPSRSTFRLIQLTTIAGWPRFFSSSNSSGVHCSPSKYARSRSANSRASMPDRSASSNHWTRRLCCSSGSRGKSSAPASRSRTATGHWSPWSLLMTVSEALMSLRRAVPQRSCWHGHHLRLSVRPHLHQCGVHLLHRRAQSVDRQQHRVQRLGGAVGRVHAVAVVVLLGQLLQLAPRLLGREGIGVLLLEVTVGHGRLRPARDVLRASFNAIATAWRWFFTTGPFADPLCRSPLPYSCMTVLTLALPFGPRPAVDFAIPSSYQRPAAASGLLPPHGLAPGLFCCASICWNCASACCAVMLGLVTVPCDICAR